MLYALLYSLLAASGLFFGALVGLIFKPGRMLTAVIMAFGSGALISALSLELVKSSFEKSGPLPLIMGFILGCFIFISGNSLIDRLGGYLRNTSNQRRFIRKQKKAFTSSLIESLSKVDIMRLLGPNELNKIVAFLEEIEYPEGCYIFRQGEEGDALYIISKGEVQIISEKEKCTPQLITVLTEGQTFGEMALVTNETRSASAQTLKATTLFKIRKKDFNRLLEDSPKVASAVSSLLAQRLSQRTNLQLQQETELKQWKKQALQETEEKNILAIEEKVFIKKDISKAASLAIFLGALIDGIPESVVIGSNTTTKIAPSLAFLIAVFISNFPEALSSAAGLLKSGFSRIKIFILWSSLILLSGVSALLSNLLLSNSAAWLTALAEAIAAGGILAMLSNTLMPEAFELGGTPVAMACGAGFICTTLLQFIS